MKPIRYVTGDATRPLGLGVAHRIVAHVVNDRGGFGKGFALAVAQRWPVVKLQYQQWSTADSFELGRVQLCNTAEDGVLVANMLAQHGYLAPGSAYPPIRYEHLATCLAELGKMATNLRASVHMPRIATGLAGGAWDRVEPLLTAALCARDIDVTVYDLPVTRKAGR